LRLAAQRGAIALASVFRQLNQIAQLSNKKLETVVRETLVGLGTSIIIKTPVDTGRARGGWIAHQNMQPTTSPEIADKSGSIAINGVQVVAGKFDIGSTFYFVNALPYAEVLEYGSSKQAPGGMVRISIAELPGILDDRIAKLR